MRAPHRKRLRIRKLAPIPEGVDLDRIAEVARYVGSPEHKDRPTYAGQPRPRANASICPAHVVGDQEAVEKWLRTAISRGAVGTPWEGNFPRYVWYKDGPIVFEGRLVNREAGWYKGFPLEESEWPSGIETLYE